jgi:hypothetical protein
MAAAAMPASHPWRRFAVLVAVVGVFAVVTLDQRALAGVALLAWLLMNGFLENRLGELSWHGSFDLFLLMVLVLAGAVGLALGEVYRAVRELRARWRAGAEAARLAAGFDEKEGTHDA